MKFKSNVYHFLVSIDDEKSIRAVYDDIIRRRCEQKSFKSVYHSLDSGTELITTLKKIEKETKDEGTYPYIHLECHGSPDGILLKNGFRVDWASLSSSIELINGACGNNLVVSMALCYGGHFNLVLLKNLKSTSIARAPAFAIIGPEKDIHFGQLEAGFSSFFNELFMTMNFDKAIDALNKESSYEHKFMVNTCQQMFRDLITTYIEMSDLSTQDKLLKRVKELNHIHRRMTGGNLKSNQQDILVDKLKSRSLDIELFDEMRHTYFWIDQYPKNEKRFGKFELVETKNI